MSALASSRTVGATRAPAARRAATPVRRAAAPARRAAAPATRRAPTVVAKAAIKAWPDPDYIDEVIAKFPDAMIANVEEGRILFAEGGYTYLDVRPELELDETGKVRGCVNVGLYTSKRVWDADKGEKVLVKAENPDFVKQVEKKIPNKETKIIVGCSDGKSYTMDALQALDAAGYVNMVALKGGFYAWFRVWDTNLRRRRGDGYTEAYDGEGSDSCGVHATGAGFERVDAIEAWTPPKY